MATHLTTPTLLDPDAPDVQALLSRTQGNILKSHGRSEVALMLIRIGPGQRPLIDFLQWAGSIVTTAAQQREDTRSWRDTGREAPPFWSAGLAYPVYRRSGVCHPATWIPRSGPEWPGSGLNGFLASGRSGVGGGCDPPGGRGYGGSRRCIGDCASGAMAPFATVMRVERGARIGYGGPNGPPRSISGFWTV